MPFSKAFWSLHMQSTWISSLQKSGDRWEVHTCSAEAGLQCHSTWILSAPLSYLQRLSEHKKISSSMIQALHLKRILFFLTNIYHKHYFLVLGYIWRQCSLDGFQSSCLHACYTYFKYEQQRISNGSTSFCKGCLTVICFPYRLWTSWACWSSAALWKVVDLTSHHSKTIELGKRVCNIFSMYPANMID